MQADLVPSTLYDKYYEVSLFNTQSFITSSLLFNYGISLNFPTSP